MLPIISELPPTPCLPNCIEHHYTLDTNGRVIYIPATDATQFVPQYDYQPDLFMELLYAIEEKDLRRIIQIIDALPVSLRKQTKKLFAEIGELKKKNNELKLQNESMQSQIDYLYELLNIEKRGICGLNKPIYF